VRPDDFVATLGRERASAILRTDDQERAAAAMEAALRGGFRIGEFTLTIPGAMELLQDFAARPGLVIGAGTVLTVAEAEQAVAHGARFLVSPVTDPEVIAAAHRLGVAVMAGAHTPGELFAAHRAGAPLQKLFPAPGIGPAFVKACLGPLPFLRIVPTHGVDADNATAWLAAGAFAVGFVASLFDPADIAAGAWQRIEARARAIRQRLAVAAPGV